VLQKSAPQSEHFRGSEVAQSRSQPIGLAEGCVERLLHASHPRGVAGRMPVGLALQATTLLCSQQLDGGSPTKGAAVPRTLLFVHGTRVQGKRFTETVRLIARRLEEHRVSAMIRGCYWGEAVGARLRAGGQSIHGHGDTGGKAPGEADQLLALWSILHTDPSYELRLLRQRPAPDAVMLGENPPPVLLRRAVREFRLSHGLVR